MAEQAKTALVTGGARGLGLGLVKRLVAEGYQVISVDINAEAGAAAAAEAGAIFVQSDVSDEDAWAGVAAEVQNRFGDLDLVFLNAAVMSRPMDAPIGDDIFDWFDKGSYTRVMRINADGVMYGIRYMVPLLRKGGSITATSSLAGVSALPFDPLYSAAKHAVVGMVRSFGPVLKHRGQRINVFCPGGMDTGMIPDDVKAMDLPMMTADDAARSCLEVARKPVTGTVWVRASVEQDLVEHTAPNLLPA